MATEVVLTGLFVLVTVKSGTGFVTVDEHCTTTELAVTASTSLVGWQMPEVMAAVLTTSAVSVAETLALNVTTAPSPEPSDTVNVQVLPEGLATVQVSEPLLTVQAGVPSTVRLDGTTSVTVAVPGPSPTLEMF